MLRRGRRPEANRSQDIAVGDSHRAEDHTQSREYTMCALVGVARCTCLYEREMLGHTAVEKLNV